MLEDGKPKFRIHSGDPTTLDWNEESESLLQGVGRILGRIVWLLKEAEKWDAIDMREKRRRLK
jgi:hypothetical protein